METTIDRTEPQEPAGSGGFGSAAPRNSSERSWPTASTPVPPRWLLKLLIVAAIALAYANSLRGAFVLDDRRGIVENPTICDLGSPGTILSTFPRSTTSGRPILNLSLALNYALGGLDPLGYHLVNIGIHALAALALFGIARRTLRLPRIDPVLSARADAIAFAAALLWAVHPIQTSSVTYVVQRAESLMGLFYLLTLYSTLRGALHAPGTPGQRGWSALAVAACALGMGTKEVMVTAPLIVLLYDRIFLSRDWKEILIRRGTIHVLLASTWAILGLLMAANPARGGTAGFDLPFSWLRYLGTEFGVILHYLRLSVWPRPLVLDYGWPIAERPGEALPAGLAVAALAGIAAWSLIRRPRLGFLGAWFFLILAPTSSIVPIADPIFEHRIYLPLAAVALTGVLAADRLIRRIAGHPPAGRRAGSRIEAIALAIVALALGLTTVSRNADYRSEVAIWKDTIRKRPLNARAHDYLGLALGREGAYDEAIRHHDEALRLRPDMQNAYYNRANTRLRAERYEEAIADYSRYLRLRRDPKAYNNRAIAHFGIGAYDEAWADVDSCRLFGLEPHEEFLEPLRQASDRNR